MARKFKTPITIDELGSASSQALAANVDGDSQNRINIDAGGKITWGSGSATGDTTLYRSAADTLKTDDAFTATSLAVTGQFTFPTSDGSADQVITTNGSGTLTWSDVSANATVSDTAPSSPATGQIWYESDTGKTFVYYDSAWVEVGASPPASPFITDLDEDTKIQVEESADEDKIRFDTAGSERMIIDSSGNVGIGTTSPATNVHISAGSSGVTSQNPAARLIIEDSSDAGIAINTSNTGNGYVRFVDPDNNSVGGMSYAHTDNDLKLRTAGSDRVTIDSSGNVGIGDTSPSAELDIKGASNPEIRLQSTDSSDPFLYFGDQVDPVRGGIGMDTSANALQLRGYNNSTRVTIDSSGNVGIGDTSPSYKLDVNGTINASDRFRIGTESGLYLSGSTIEVGSAASGRSLYLNAGASARVHIDSSGRVGINGNPSAQAGNEYMLFVGASGGGINIDFPTTATTSGLMKGYSNVGGTDTLQFIIRTDGDFESRTNSYGATSDAATKQDIVDAPSQWDDIKAVQLRKYRLIDDVTENGDNAITQLGVIAQELEASGMGGLVVDADPDNDKPHKSVKYSVLLLKALGALQEAMTRIEALEAN